MKKRRKRRDWCQSGRLRARVLLPYIKGISEISRACKPLSVQTVFTSRYTLRKSLMKVKGRPGMMDANGHRSVCKHHKQRAKSNCISNESERTRPSHLSIYLRERIIALWEEGNTVSEILATLESKGWRTSRATVRRWVFAGEWMMDCRINIVVNKNQRSPQKWLPLHKVWPDDFRCEQSKKKWICTNVLGHRKFIENVIWTEKSSVQLTPHCQTMRVKIRKERVLKPAAKHAVKVHVWAGTSKRGATNMCVFD